MHKRLNWLSFANSYEFYRKDQQFWCTASLWSSNQVYLDPKNMFRFNQNLICSWINKNNMKWLKTCQKQTVIEKRTTTLSAYKGLKSKSKNCVEKPKAALFKHIFVYFNSKYKTAKWSQLKAFSVASLVSLNLSSHIPSRVLEKRPPIFFVFIYWEAAN